MVANDHPSANRSIAHRHISSVNFLRFATLAAARPFAKASAYWWRYPLRLTFRRSSLDTVDLETPSHRAISEMLFLFRFCSQMMLRSLPVRR